MSYTKLNYHIVFATKDRRAMLKADVMPRLVKYIGGIVRNLKGKLLEAGGSEDHMHLATSIHPTVDPAGFVRDIKANSSRWIHETFTHLGDFQWQDGYSAFTVSESVLPDVIKYIGNQPEHHKKITFGDELTALLNKHGIKFDKRYVSA